MSIYPIERITPLSSFRYLIPRTDHGAIFWLLLSGGHCRTLVDDRMLQQPLWYITSAARTSGSGGKLDFPLRNSFHCGPPLNDSMAPPGRAHPVQDFICLVSITEEEACPPGNRSAGAAGDSRRRALAAQAAQAFPLLRPLRELDFIIICDVLSGNSATHLALPYH
ncbi:hypothetical protein GWK47_043403 [Chionoecetes opilio]|uniref:Uncharacterized protein n=1 Tax=Chionoecetes opilio TaxID=41210 RepID=A0A8J4YF28_CHIOP|nr:hypothetical protein GWK47_043403 [Chionoecetes opilio]